MRFYVPDPFIGRRSLSQSLPQSHSVPVSRPLADDTMMVVLKCLLKDRRKIVRVEGMAWNDDDDGNATMPEWVHL